MDENQGNPPPVQAADAPRDAAPAPPGDRPEAAGAPPAALRGLMRLLALVALPISAYLLYASLQGGRVWGCAAGLPCDRVLKSPWSSVLGVPVAGVAAGVYLAALAALAFIGPRTRAPSRETPWAALLLFAGAIIGAAVWFVAVQIYFVEAMCTYCMAAHATGVLLAVLILVCAPRRPGAEADTGTPGALRRSTAWLLPVLGLASVVFLAGIQVLYPPRVEPVAYGTLAIPPELHPVLGDPRAPYRVVALYDYTCPHCRTVHGYLAEARRRYGRQFALVMLPAPLELVGMKSHAGGHELARLALAVWTADASKFEAYDAWLLEGEDPPTAAEARARAEGMVGPDALRRAYDAGRLDPHLDANTRLYREIGRRTRYEALPMILAGDQAIVGQPADENELFASLEEILGVKPGG